jgi:hypothetical protein
MPNVLNSEGTRICNVVESNHMPRLVKLDRRLGRTVENLWALGPIMQCFLEG